MKKKNDFFENILLVLIFLAIAQAFLDDYSILRNWTVSVRNLILIAGFVFDLVFTVEFIVRSVLSGKKNRFGFYFLHQKGWIDLLSSLPLLIFVSGPGVISLFFGGTASGSAVWRLLKIIKAIRVAKVLRLIRVLKIFGKIQNANSTMAQRHIAEISSCGVSAVIFVLILFSSLNISSLARLQEQNILQWETRLSEMKSFGEEYRIPETDIWKKVLLNDPQVISFYFFEKELIDRRSLLFFNDRYSANEFKKIDLYPYQIILDLKSFVKKQAQISLTFFFMILAMIFSYMFIYTRIFAQHISDPLYVMMRGMDEDDYNFNVKIDHRFGDEEIYRLADLYNRKFLPLKDKERLFSGEKDKKSKISFDDFMKLK